MISIKVYKFQVTLLVHGAVFPLNSFCFPLARTSFSHAWKWAPQSVKWHSLSGVYKLTADAYHMASLQHTILNLKVKKIWYGLSVLLVPRKNFMYIRTLFSFRLLELHSWSPILTFHNGWQSPIHSFIHAIWVHCDAHHVHSRWHQDSTQTAF